MAGPSHSDADVTQAILGWLYEDRQPADLYELLGKPRFDPDWHQLHRDLRAGYAAVLKYQVHQDRAVADRAMALQRELGRADRVLSDAQRLKAHHEAIIAHLRESYARARADGGDWSTERLRRWLETEGDVHPARVGDVARLLSAPTNETLDCSFYDTQKIVPVDGLTAEEPLVAEVVEEDDLRVFGAALAAVPPPRRSPPGAVPPKRPPRRGPSSRDSAPGTRTRKAGPDATRARGRTGPVRRERQRRPSPRRKLANLTRRQQVIVCLVVAGVLWLVFLLIVWILLKPGNAWHGRLAEIRGHDGEIHLLIALDPSGFSGQSSVEAFTRDDLADELADTISEEDARRLRAEGHAGVRGDRVKVTGTRAQGAGPSFRLDESATLIELNEVDNITQDMLVLDAEGRRRRTEMWDPGLLARLIRIHPTPTHRVHFRACFGEFDNGNIWVYPSPTDRRRVLVEFSDATAADFAAYDDGDEIEVTARVSDSATPEELVLRGSRVTLLEPSQNEPGGGTP